MKLLGTIVGSHVRLDTPSRLPEGSRVSVVFDDGDDDFAPPPPTETYAQHLAILRESIALAEAGHQGRSAAEVFADIERQLDLPFANRK